MSTTPEIRISQISARIEQGDLTFNELSSIAEELSSLMTSSSGKTRLAAEKVFEESQIFKSKMVKEDVSQINRLAKLGERAQELTACLDEMDPQELEDEVLTLAADAKKMKKFFNPILEGRAKKVVDEVEDLELGLVFSVLGELSQTGHFAMSLERKAEALEAGGR